MNADVRRYISSPQLTVIGRIAIPRHAFRLVFRNDLMSVPGSLGAVATFFLALVIQVMIVALF